MHSVIARFGGDMVVPIVIVLLAIGFLLTVRFIASRYKKIPPTKAGIFYGRKYRVKIGEAEETRGYMVVLGGGRVLLPLVEDYQEMPTSAFQVAINEDNIPNKDNVPFYVTGVATCKVSTIPENLYRAAGAFLGKSNQEVELFIRNILTGHLRSIVGKMDIDELLRDRDAFNKKLIEDSAPELSKLGMELVNMVIQTLTDKKGYIDALGERAVAQTKSQAAIQVAEAERDRDIAVSNAKQAAETIAASNAAKIAEAQRDRDVTMANAKATSQTQQAIADKAFSIADAAQTQKLLVAEAQRDAAGKEAQIKVQETEALRRQKELEATVIKQAEADKQKRIINAQAEKEAHVIEAQATAEVLTATAEAKKNAATLEGQGEAAKTEAMLVAQAKGAAAAKREALVAEAEGTEKLATALKDMDAAARFMLVLDRMPNLLEKGGDSVAKVMEAIFSGIAAPLGNIDSIQIVDMGGNGKGLDQMSSLVPNMLAKFLATAKAQGIDVSSLLAKIGVDPSALVAMLSAPTKAPNGAAHAVPVPAPAVHSTTLEV